MEIIINGERQKLEDGLNITKLLLITEVDQPEYVSVQLNGDFAERDKFDETILKEGDEVDFLYFMGGGQ